MKLEKVMLVDAGASFGVEKRLVAAGCGVIKVSSGRLAVSLAQREMFDAIVLVSTGEEMDLAETALNLSDIKGSMPIIIVADGAGNKQTAVEPELVAHAGQNIKVLSTRGLGKLLKLFK
ncbi:MAG: hypothetical protein HY695_09960 [Deltaproteobacteria bacterium]|nr:hypothetical protein [Deltaproteobacteria bacterium]